VPRRRVSVNRVQRNHKENSDGRGFGYLDFDAQKGGFWVVKITEKKAAGEVESNNQRRGRQLVHL